MTHHVELRQFPHNMCRFNLSDRELRTIVGPWAHGEWVEFGERKWSPHQAKLTVLEGPELAMEQLTMGRGWRAAQRQSEDVTERVLEAARAVGNGPAPASAARGRASVADGPATASAPEVSSMGKAMGEGALAGELGSLLGADPTALLAAWRLLAAADPGRRPSECLAAAERAVRTAAAPPS
jgi:hypothetical protein